MKFFIKSAVLTAVVTGLVIPSTAFATNGAWLIGFGAKSRSMGGTGVADNRGAMAAAFNPASMSESGNRFDMGADLFMPPRAIKHESTRLGYTNEQSNHDLFLVPSMGLTYDLGEKMTVGFAFIGAGLKTEYDQAATNSSCQAVNAGRVPGYQPGQCPPTVFNALGTVAGKEAGVELIQMQMLPSISYKLNKQHSIGATLVIAASYFRAEGLEDFEELGFTSSPGNFTDGHWDSVLGSGFRLGWLGKFSDDKLRVGVNYSSRVWMGKFNQYSNLFAEQGSFDIPENYSLGIAYDFTPAVTVTFDIQQINWSDVASIGNPGPNAANPNDLLPLCPQGTDQAPCLLGGDKGLGFGWTDQTVFKLGANWAINETWSARAGWNYAKSPIEEDQVLFNMLAPATPEHHLTMGVGFELSETFVIDGSLVYAFSNPINGPTAFGPGGAVVTGTNASIDMKQLSIGGALGIRF
jgi:long-chain fatty acid transport protein